MRKGLAGVMLAAGLAVAGPAAGQEAKAEAAKPAYPTVAAVLGACQADLVRLCGEVPFRMNRLAGCLREKRAELSTGCQAVQQDFRGQAQAARERLRPVASAADQACAADVKLLCGEVSRGRAAACVRANEAKLSEGCRTASAELRKVQRELRGDPARN